MPYIIPTFDEIRTRQLRDVRALDADAPADADSDHYVRASATASAVSGLYDYQAWQARQIIPDTADPEYLEMHCALRGITLKQATKSTGTAALTGDAGAAVPQGTEIKAGNGDIYLTVEEVKIGEGGTADVDVQADSVGERDDLDNAPATLTNAPTGVHGNATLTVSGGTDIESYDSLLERLLEYMRDPPGGGNAADYRRWAKEVDGVADATVYPLRQGPGTVDIVISGADGIPGPDIVAACQAHIDEMRPATARQVTVFAPSALSVDFTVKIKSDGTRTLQEIKPDVRDVLAARIGLLRPGESLVLSKMLGAVTGIAGVADAEIAEPQGNVTATALQWVTIGNIEVLAL